MATINASTSGVGGVITTADATGVLDLQTADVTRASVSSSGLKISRVDSSNEGGQLDLCRSTDNTSAWAIDVYGNTSTPSLRFVDNVAAAARMVVDGSGNVGIGTSSPSYKLQVSTSLPTGVSLGALDSSSFVSNGIAFRSLGNQAGISGTTYAKQIFAGNSPDIMEIYNGANYPLVFGTNATERMRIDTGGQVLVGKSTTANNLAGVQLGVENSYGRVFCTKTLSGNVNGLLNYHNGTYVGGINYDNTNTSFPTSSDVRLKKDIVEAGSASEKIDAIRIVSHGWKHDDAVVDFGIIAQELYEVMPRAVAKGDDGEEIETTWGVDYSKLVPMLIKAHQEQQAIINDLKARIEVLENK